jgi:iron complex transport system substrate-binding protein
MKQQLRIISLEPYLTELVLALGLKDSLVGISQDCAQHLPELKHLLKVTAAAGEERAQLPAWAQSLTQERLLLQEFLLAKPTHVLCTWPTAAAQDTRFAATREALQTAIGSPCTLLALHATQLEEIYELYAELGRGLGVAAQGQALAQRFKAQLMSWADSFYDRMHHKHVVVLSNLNPPTLLCGWVSDLLRALSAQPMPPSQGAAAVQLEYATDWQSIEKFRPDVLVLALRGQCLAATLEHLAHLEALPQWQQMPAVKRGEVIFCDAVRHFYALGPRLTETLGVLVSAVAGFDSGYITQRDSFQRLRWAELHRKPHVKPDR